MRSLVGLVPFFLLICFLWGSLCFGASAAETQEEKVSLDFVDASLPDVVRSLSLAYGTPFLVDENLSTRVTFHLEGVGLLEGVRALCDASGLDLVQEGKVFHIRSRRIRGENQFLGDSNRVDVSVRDKDVKEFVEEFASNTGLNILVAPQVNGRVSGNLHGIPARVAVRLLLSANGYRVREESGVIQVDMPRGEGALGLPDFHRDGDLFYGNFSGTPLRDVVRNISSAAGLNLAVYGNLQESVELRFDGLSLGELLEALFKGSFYTYELDSLSLRIFEKGIQTPLSRNLLYSLKFIQPEKALQQLSKFSPKGGFVASEVREQNALLLGGSQGEIDWAVKLLSEIDMPALQVTLSCYIVEFKKGKSFEIGLHGGANRKTGEYNLGLRGFLDFLSADISKSGSFGKIGILPDRFEMELSSMEEKNQAEVLARPSLTTLNGNKAELNVTNTVYYLVSQVSADGFPITDYRSFNDGISLEITPHVTQEGFITLEVSPEIKTAGRSSGDGPRDISTRNMKTSVILQNGETLCLGGLLRKSKSEVRTAVPFLGSIPVIGRFFSYVSEEEEENELAIFITPEVKP